VKADLFNPLAVLWSVALAAIVYLAVSLSHAEAAIDRIDAQGIPSRLTAIETQLPVLLSVQMATLNALRRANGLPPTTPEAVLAGDDATHKDKQQ